MPVRAYDAHRVIAQDDHAVPYRLLPTIVNGLRDPWSRDLHTPSWAVIARASRGFTSAGLQIAAAPSPHRIASHRDPTRLECCFRSDPTRDRAQVRPSLRRARGRRTEGQKAEGRSRQQASRQQAAEAQKRRRRRPKRSARVYLSIPIAGVHSCTLAKPGRAWHLICTQERIRSPARSPSRRRSPGPGGPADTHLPRSPRRDARLC